TRPLRSSDSAAMPSGPFILSRITLTFAGKMTMLRMVVSFLAIFGCRNWARANIGASTVISTAMSAVLDLRSFATAGEYGNIIAVVSLGFQCVAECARDRWLPARVRDTFRIPWRHLLFGQAVRITCPVRDARRQRDSLRIVHGDKALRTFADASS